MATNDDQTIICAQVNPRIELRMLGREHAVELHNLLDANRAHLRPWHSWVDNLRTVDEVERKILVWEQQYKARQIIHVSIWFDGRLCGMISHSNLDWTNGWTSLSYWLDAAHQGKGIMTTCCRAVIAHTFKNWKFNRVTIECATDNTRSRAIPERLGFKLEGIVRGIEWLQDHHADHAIYGLLRSDCRFLPNGVMDPVADDSWKLTGRSALPCRMKGSFERMLKLAFETHTAGRTQEAEDMCRVLMQVRPDNAQLLFLLGMILHDSQQDEEAVKWLSLAAQYQPQTARIFKGLGCAYQQLEEHELAVKSFERALELEPKSGASCYNLANNCYPLGQIERAAALYQKAVEIDPRDSGSWNNLGKCLRELNQPDKSIEAYNRAIELAPGYAMARYGRAMSLLTAGRLAEGFRDYEARWYAMKARTFPQPVWRGEQAPGKTLVLLAEQGFGDAIQMIRFIPMVRERVGRVVLECRPELKTLFKYSNCADEVISYGDPIPPFDCFIPLGSLPHAIGVTLDTIPSRTPYLRSPVGEPLLAARSSRLNVGLVWAGNPTHHQDAARSIQLKELTPILQVLDVAFYNLQKPVPARDESCLLANHGIIDSSFVARDFLDTASIVARLDLVIAVDTAVAHLAGALGKPVWLLLQNVPDWRWFLDRTDTPWYPTMQLFRQVKRGNWELPVLRVAEALRRMADSHCTSGHRCSQACSGDKRRNGSHRLTPIVSMAPLSR